MSLRRENIERRFSQNRMIRIFMLLNLDILFGSLHALHVLVEMLVLVNATGSDNGAEI